MSIEMQLRETFRRAADGLGPALPAADVRAEGMRVLSRRRNRRRATVLSAGLAVLLIAVAVPVGLSLLRPPDSRLASPAAIPAADIFGVPTRGSLADDAGFVEAIRQLSWAESGVSGTDDDLQIPDAPVETRHVTFAGEVAGGRWALVVGANTSQPTGEAAAPELQTDLGALSDIAAVWFVGPSGATADEMVMVSVPRGISPDLPSSLYDGATGALVVVSAPGDVIEISPRSEVAADATISRNYVDTGVLDGLVVTTTEPNPYGGMLPAVQYRVSRAGVVVAEQTPDGYSDPDGTELPFVALDYVRPAIDFGLATEMDRQVQRLAADLLGEYGLRPDQLDLLVHYAGPVPGRTEEPAGLTVLSATFPSGAVLTRAEWTEQVREPQGPQAGASFGGGWCADDRSAAGTPAAERVLAIRCDVGSGVGDGQLPESEVSLVVIAPPALADSQVTAANGTVTVDLGDHGVGIIPFPEGAQTVVVTPADGTVVVEVPIITL